MVLVRESVCLLVIGQTNRQTDRLLGGASVRRSRIEEQYSSERQWEVKPAFAFSPFEKKRRRKKKKKKQHLEVGGGEGIHASKQQQQQLIDFFCYFFFLSLVRRRKKGKFNSIHAQVARARLNSSFPDRERRKGREREEERRKKKRRRRGMRRRKRKVMTNKKTALAFSLGKTGP